MSEPAKRPGTHPEEPITVTAHPPERGRRPDPVVLPCGCCCCCCCCLHTIGGLVGGLTGSFRPIRTPPRPVDPDFPFPFRRDELDEDGPLIPAGLLYWLLVSFLIAVTSVWYYVGAGAKNPEDLFVGVLLAIFFLPGLQLGASLLALLGVAVFYRDRLASLSRVGQITLWSFVGTMIGIVLMVGLCGVFGLLSKM